VEIEFEGGESGETTAQINDNKNKKENLNRDDRCRKRWIIVQQKAIISQ
jgi:hypothetical protein